MRQLKKVLARPVEPGCFSAPQTFLDGICHFEIDSAPKFPLGGVYVKEVSCFDGDVGSLWRDGREVCIGKHVVARTCDAVDEHVLAGTSNTVVEYVVARTCDAVVEHIIACTRYALVVFD